MASADGWLVHPSDADETRALPDLGDLLRAYRAAESLTQGELAQLLGLDQSYVSQIERGKRIIRNVELLLHISDVLKIPRSQLGLSQDASSASFKTPKSGAVRLQRPDQVEASQQRWREERRFLNRHRSDLARIACTLYKSGVTVPSTPLISPSFWLPEDPVRLEDIRITLTTDPHPWQIRGTEPESQAVRPLRAPGKQYDSYTSAIRYIDTPALFENRPSYRLLDMGWVGDGGEMTFGLANYFDKLAISEAVGHELAALKLRHPGNFTGSRSSIWNDLPFRALIGDPFDCTRRAIVPAITTLTLRRRRTHGTATFPLHWRDPAKVATASGLYDVIPAGEFQPSSMAPWDQRNDFDIWRNIVRELSEELLGTPEHDGSQSNPIDYDSWPFYRALQEARQGGQLSVYCLGVALDALTLAATILTVLVIDDVVFDEIFTDIVQVNAEGRIVSVDQGEGIPFDDVTVARLLKTQPLAPPGAGCLARAWWHRGLLLAP
jgi:transcriptional regulator with XRE-family HTH domain